ncbi:MAG: carboxypeptidase-like regulatory domain-containing protein [Acidobacteriota bacterium]
MQRIVLLLLSALPLFAQCSLTVVVEDASAGRVANAAIRLRDQTTSRILAAVTSAEGTASFAAVPCAAYQLTAAFAGFEDSTAAVRLAERNPAQLKLTLRTRGLSEQVQVIEGADLLQTTRAT